MKPFEGPLPPAGMAAAAQAAMPEAEPTTVRRLERGEETRWRAFVDAEPQATFFHRVEWKGIFENVLRHRAHYLLAERGGQVAGVLPLVEVRSRLFGHALSSLPFAVYGGAVAQDRVAREALHRAAVDIGRTLGVRHVELRHRERCDPAWPQQDLYVTFRKTILPDVDANMAAIPRKQRAMVRKAIQRGLASEIDAGIDRFYRLYADNQHRHGTPPHARRTFEALRAAFGADCEVLTVLAPGGEPVSSVMSFYWRDEVLPYYAGDALAARELAANDFKYWELLRRACERGLRVFDYGRSKRDSGSYAFKKNWGFEPQPLHYEYPLLAGGAVPQNNPANPKYRAFIALWRRLPQPLANTIGPAIARNLG
jgi:FemAB-related protein (PEP-CTERM system-associated)